MMRNFLFCLRTLTKYLPIMIFISYTSFMIGRLLDVDEISEKEEFFIRLKGPLEQDDPKLIDFIRTKYIDPPSSRPYNLSKDIFYYQSKNKYSWPIIHRILKRIFPTKKGGFFVEAGALDGEFLSNTLALEKDQGWTGLLIEANPHSYRRLLTKHRKSWSSNTCLSSTSFPKESVFVSLSKNKDSKFPWIYRGASHMEENTLPPAFDNFFEGTLSTYSKVQCFPLYSYLLALNVTEIDLIILDLQGSEKEVVETIPFEKLKIKAFIVEHYFSSNKSIDAEFKKFFTDKGFRLINCYGEPDYAFILEKEFKDYEFPEIENCAQNLFPMEEKIESRIK